MAVLNLADQLRRSREARGLSLRTVGRIVGVSSSTLHRWESGDGRPPEDVLAHLSHLFRATFQAEPEGRIVLDAFHRGALLRALRVRQGFSLHDASERFGHSVGTISRWESGTREAGNHVVPLYLNVFKAADPETEALVTRETLNPVGVESERHLIDMIERLRSQKLDGVYRPTDLDYLAAHAALSKRDPRLRMRLVDAYIERLEWEYRYREAYQWAQKNLNQAREVGDYDFVGRSIRVVSQQLITEDHKPEKGLEFLLNAVRLTQGSRSEEMVGREAADRLAQAGRIAEALTMLKLLRGTPALESGLRKTGDYRYLRASIAISAKKFDVALNEISEAEHPDPYMKTFIVQIEAEARHALGERKHSEKALEKGIQSLDKPGLGHFIIGLVDRLKTVASEPYRPDLWTWKSTLSLRGIASQRHG